MTNEELFLESVFNKKHRVYGFELKTLTLFHLGLLNALKNPIITGDRVKPKDVMSAALICSSTNYDDFIRRSKGFAGYFMPLFNFEKQLSSFFAYYEDHMSLPNSLQTESSGKANPFPYVLTFLAKTIKVFSYNFFHQVTCAIFSCIGVHANFNTKTIIHKVFDMLVFKNIF